MSSEAFDTVMHASPVGRPPIVPRVLAWVGLVGSALLDGFAAHGAFLDMKRRGIDPAAAAQVLLISHFSQRG